MQEVQERPPPEVPILSKRLISSARAVQTLRRPAPVSPLPARPTPTSKDDSVIPSTATPAVPPPTPPKHLKAQNNSDDSNPKPALPPLPPPRAKPTESPATVETVLKSPNSVQNPPPTPPETTSRRLRPRSRNRASAPSNFSIAKDPRRSDDSSDAPTFSFALLSPSASETGTYYISMPATRPRPPEGLGPRPDSIDWDSLASAAGQIQSPIDWSSSYGSLESFTQAMRGETGKANNIFSTLLPPPLLSALLCSQKLNSLSCRETFRIVSKHELYQRQEQLDF